MKRWIRALARNRILHLFLGTVVALTGLWEVGETLGQDLLSGEFHGGHGVVLIGLWHMARALAEIVEASDYLDEGLE
ncbi:MAG: hypothetical protein HOF91_22380 [Rhodospirillaceae bacterium]|nr:hypothetical protein [Rhodospirillaceae bacterium]MBT3495075.1 hypothetical protein [Rhodospirillaceae bacterium]MBT3782772.1 hypothetical protein [Rhodospirillaceae bacterium]MBT4561549.1 hypothetical protein [Rhodospirillaceae bacterium]MBT4741611.1 hypothetical protein [Rhodospirillaceae bacterium]